MLTVSLFYITMRLAHALSRLVLRFEWEGHVGMWVGKRAAKHSSQIPTLDEWKASLRIMPWNCMPQGLYETFTDHWRKECSIMCSVYSLQAIV